MTDNQLLRVILSRAIKVGKKIDNRLDNPQLVLTQQYGKKLYFALKFDWSTQPLPLSLLLLSFSKNGINQIFVLPELPKRLMKWKHDVIHEICQNAFMTYDFDISKEPKEVVHVFFSAVISALNTPGMSFNLSAAPDNPLFGPNETYEEVQVEADLMEFENGWMA